jgi:hypothetical protein
MKRQTKLRRAEEVLYMLGLTDCADTLVGGPLLKVHLDTDGFRRTSR